ncbi:proton-conducting transporter membrane subunit [Pseudochelatococcus lubricantis]|uniref:proton-conducting transporter transmembrane domain-containing protein n=1 Tax=Pseudochelatococcus lubricantis TaxID=1538102 RepID=UPI0035F0F048
MSVLFHPLNIYILGLGGGFLIPLLYRLAKSRLPLVFFFALAGIAVVSGVSFVEVLSGAPAIEVLTAGTAPPVSISLRLGVVEGFFAFSVNVVSLLGAIHLWPRLREHYGAMLLYLIGVMGINGMVMTRDLFNLFVFLEIVSIATYGLLGLAGTARSLAAAFKYIVATVIASTFFLLATALLYFTTGTLNIDALASLPEPPAGPIATTALILLLAALLVELKPFPANGWGIDVYETAPGGIAAFVSVGVSAGVFFALYKLLPLFAPWLDLIAFSGGLTFVASNLLGLRQVRVQRMLGYSSVGQMGLLTLALALLEKNGAVPAIPLVVGGLFLNHLLAKAGLFWLADLVGRQSTAGWSPVARRRVLVASFAALVVAISGLPPFPGFFAKWELVMQLSAAGYGWTIAAVLVGSLLEAAYMFRWLGRSLHTRTDETLTVTGPLQVAPVAGAILLLLAGGGLAAFLAAPFSLWIFAPLAAGAALALVERLLHPSGRVKAALALLSVAVIGPWLLPGVYGIAWLFGALFIGGGLVVGLGALYRAEPRPYYYPLLAVTLLSMPALTGAMTGLEFLVCWEFVTIGSYFLIAHGGRTGSQTLRYLLFSLAAAFLLLAGFGQIYGVSGTVDLGVLRMLDADANLAFVLLAAGCLVKAGVLGVHVWVPGTYALADDDLTALLSAVISKVAIFGLLSITYLAIRSQSGLDLAHLLAWIGFATTLICAGLALFQDNVKRMLAYSSVSQIGYIVAAIALMSHIGWVTALYLVASHLLVKGVLFLAVAGVILRTGAGNFSSLGGLAGRMPWTFAASVIALTAMAGLPPLAGFGSKWLLIGTMMDREWYALAAVGFLATFAGFLYMARFAYGLFLRDRGAAYAQVAEAPAALVVPQALLVAGILVLSFYPKLLMEPLSLAIDPYFAASLIWEGRSLEQIYDALNPLPVMSMAVVISLALFGLAVLVYRRYAPARDETGGTSPISGFLMFFKGVLGRVNVPGFSALWDGLAGVTLRLAGNVRLLYSGNGQTYALYVLVYTIALYFAA